LRNMFVGEAHCSYIVRLLAQGCSNTWQADHVGSDISITTKCCG
jgi:hypothetical protein